MLITRKIVRKTTQVINNRRKKSDDNCQLKLKNTIDKYVFVEKHRNFEQIKRRFSKKLNN